MSDGAEWDDPVPIRSILADRVISHLRGISFVLYGMTLFPLFSNQTLLETGFVPSYSTSFTQPNIYFLYCIDGANEVILMVPYVR